MRNEEVAEAEPFVVFALLFSPLPREYIRHFVVICGGKVIIITYFIEIRGFKSFLNDDRANAKEIVRETANLQT